MAADPLWNDLVSKFLFFFCIFNEDFEPREASSTSQWRQSYSVFVLRQGDPKPTDLIKLCHYDNTLYCKKTV